MCDVCDKDLIMILYVDADIEISGGLEGVKNNIIKIF